MAARSIRHESAISRLLGLRVRILRCMDTSLLSVAYCDVEVSVSADDLFRQESYQEWCV
jgi:hypothetical protein